MSVPGSTRRREDVRAQDCFALPAAFALVSRRVVEHHDGAATAVVRRQQGDAFGVVEARAERDIDDLLQSVGEDHALLLRRGPSLPAEDGHRPVEVLSRAGQD